MAEAQTIGRAESELNSVVDLLGGDRTFSHPVCSRLDAHETILKGFPNTALTHLVGRVSSLQKADVMEKAVGISLRTYQRRKSAGARTPLSREQSGRTWKFAEILTKATAVFGSQEDAEAWLSEPAMGLDWRRPIDLLATPTGTELVETFLGQLEYEVYV